MTTLSLRHRHLAATWWASAALVPVCMYFVVVPYGTRGWAGAGWLLVHSLNLLPHEAGHFFFRFFGTFLMFAGGTILQLAFPCLFAWYFLSNDGRLGLQVSLAWLGQNFVDVSVYAADAQHRSMPLLGGLGPEAHDWWNLLTMLGWLEHTPLVAGALYACAFVPWALMLVVPLRVG